MPVYDGLLDFFRQFFEDDYHTFAGIEIQAELPQENLYNIETDNAVYQDKFS